VKILLPLGLVQQCINLIAALVLNQKPFFIFTVIHNRKGQYFKTRYYSYTQRWGQFGTVYKHRLQSYINIVYTFLAVV
jgi:hypothetical protein